tara:strand:+ start:389 stop:568 length:180 start_codon:yes stop_codon:yes gene_type:complete
MKITIKGSTGRGSGIAEREVSIETGYDDMSIEDVMREIRGLLIAQGFNVNSVDEYIHLD